MSGPRLLVVAGGGRTVASTRHRLWNYRPFLEQDCRSVAWVAYGGGRERSVLRALRLKMEFVGRLVAAGTDQDVVLVQKVLPPASILRQWKRRGARVVYDFDDALWARAVTGETESAWRRRRARFDHVLSEADVVVAGSPPLADYARTLARRVEIVYPSLDRSVFQGLKRPGGPELVVGWVGNDQSQVYLRALEPVLTEVLSARSGVRLAVCSSRPPELAPALSGRMTFVPWSEEAEPRVAASFDVAISPLAHDEWSRARGGRVSVLLSMAAGVPVVASPGGGVAELAGNDGGVVFADDPAAWRAALARLLDDSEERRRLGARARAVIDANVWADVQYPRLRSILFGERPDPPAQVVEASAR